MTARPTPASATPFSGETLRRPCPLCSAGRAVAAFERADGANFVECQTCTLTFASPAPSAAALESFYANYYSEFRVLRSPSLSSLQAAARAGAYDPLTAFGLQHFGGVPRSAADVGCGQGARLAMLRELGVSRLAGCELDAKGVLVAQAEYGLQVTQGDAATLAAHRFQLVFLSEVIEHVLDPIGLLQQCSRLLEPTGILVISTPNGTARFRAREEWKGLTSDFDHVALFSVQSLRTALLASGLDAIETLPYGLPSPSSERSIQVAGPGGFAGVGGKVARLVQRLRSSVRASHAALEREWGYSLLCAARLKDTTAAKS